MNPKKHALTLGLCAALQLACFGQPEEAPRRPENDAAAISQAATFPNEEKKRSFLLVLAQIEVTHKQAYELLKSTPNGINSGTLLKLIQIQETSISEEGTANPEEFNRDFIHFLKVKKDKGYTILHYMARWHHLLIPYIETLWEVDASLKDVIDLLGVRDNRNAPVFFYMCKPNVHGGIQLADIYALLFQRALSEGLSEEELLQFILPHLQVITHPEDETALSLLSVRALRKKEGRSADPFAVYLLGQLSAHGLIAPENRAAPETLPATAPETTTLMQAQAPQGALGNLKLSLLS